ncbi:MAG: M42 family peptidase [Candidatus Eisenbacteria bacterium]|nr:M42 family peptidase [Candidatus Eisenbacteria bacterium]
MRRRVAMEFLKRLTETPGIPGREGRVRDLIREHTDGWWDELHEDAIGNLIGVIKAARRKRGLKEKAVVIGCHLDQIGFYVRHVDDSGFLRIQHAGGFDTRNLFARRVKVMTGGGDLPGILNPATRPVHVASDEEKRKIPKVNEFVIDLGLPPAQVKRRVKPGDPVVIEQTTIEMGQHVCGQAMDNRISPWVALNAIKKAKGKNVYDIYWLGSAQEEVGVRGALVAAQNIKAEVAIAVDVTLAVDTPGTQKEEAISRLGDGVALKIMDSLSISTRSLLDDFVKLANRKKIKFQYEILPMGGTDAGPLQRYGGGRRTITLSVPCRYVHTVVETVHKKDLDAAVNLLAAWLMGQ